MMEDQTTATPELTLERINTPPAQTWNYLRANDITLTVPQLSRKGDVYFALPRLFEGIECGVGQEATAWVVSQAADARYVEVRAGERREEPIVVDVDADAGEVHDVGVMVRAGAEACVVVNVHGASDEQATSAALVRIIAERNATVRVLEFVAAGASQQHIESVGIQAASGARVVVQQYFLSTGTLVAGIATSLDGDHARIDHTCRYLVRGHEVADINHVVRQRGRNTRANVRESGVLDDHAKKALRATIDLVHGSSGSEGTELESVLMLSDDVTNKTVPTILCDEDDVSGNHGATIGPVGPEQFQYLCDRGLSRQEAEALYVRALLDEALIAAPTPEVRTCVLRHARTVLGDEVANDLVEGLGLNEEGA
ncbi:MAG: SufD family Fe-S cluster assembly protein [Coriobacteriales bacterium]|nr:SufD family Fe-S cluster assembly protein [Coriobacteriales bacterium]